MAHSHYELSETRNAHQKGRGVRIPYPHYGLTGKTIRIRKKAPINEESDRGSALVYPWAYTERKVYVIQETPYFIAIEIPVHRNPGGFDDSVPYSTSIHKHDITNGEFILKTLDGERIR